MGLQYTPKLGYPSYVRAAAPLICPNCDSSDVRRSRNEGLVGVFLSKFGLWPFRRRSCRRKFYRTGNFRTASSLADLTRVTKANPEA